MTATKEIGTFGIIHTYEEVSPKQIVRWTPHNLRAHEKIAPKDPEFLELVESIRASGILQPIIVQTSATPDAGALTAYNGIVGSRRVRAAIAAGLATIPAIVRDDLTEQQIVEVVTVENLQRADLSPLMEAEQLGRLFLNNPELSIGDVAHRIGKDASHIRRRLQLRHLLDDGKQAVTDGKLPIGIALILARLTPEHQGTAFPVIMGTKGQRQGWGATRRVMSEREVKDFIAEEFMLDLSSAPFPIEDPDLVPKAGACTTCPKRTGNAPDLWGDMKGSASRCTDPACFKAKQTAFVALGYRQASTPPAAAVEEKAKTVKTNGTATVARKDTKPAAPAPIPISFRYEQERENPKAPTLEKPLGSAHFQLAKGKTKCDSLERAYVVDAGDSGTKIGDVVQICRDAKCKVHNAGAAVTHKPREDAYTKRQRDAERALKRKRAVLQALLTAAVAKIAAGAKVTRGDREHIAKAYVGRLWHEHVKKLAGILGLEDGKGKDNRRDRQGLVLRWIPKATPAQLDALLLACAYSDAAWPSYSGGRDGSGALEAFAKRVGVNVKAVREAAAPKVKAKTGRQIAAAVLAKRKRKAKAK